MDPSLPRFGIANAPRTLLLNEASGSIHMPRHYRVKAKGSEERRGVIRDEPRSTSL
jgi:hypothetical protein